MKMNKLSSDRYIYLITLVLITCIYFLMRLAIGVVYLKKEFPVILILLIIIFYLGYKVVKYRLVKYDKNNFYFSNILGNQKEIIPLESIKSIRFTRSYSGSLLEHNIKYEVSGKRKNVLTYISLSTSLTNLISFLEGKNPSVANMLKK